MADFSVLMPVYAGDRAAYVAAALDSVTVSQTRPPSEVVVVADGPVGDDIEDVLARYPDIHLVRLPENRGLTEALNAGLAACRYDIVARQDADDVSQPDRFALQVPLVESGLDLVGSDIVEFGEDGPGDRREMPVDASAIEAALPLRDPFAHPSVVYRKGAVAAVGGYEELAGMEDYWLFARMVAAGARCVNVPAPLVNYRVDAGAYSRRGGWRLLLTEYRMQQRLYWLGVTGVAGFLRNLAIRGPYRLIPTSVRRVIYRVVGLKGLFSRS
ncbi:MAG: glycosyltransferase [Actinomycetaceae bacterium]|nr:glycosyltransferase [Actinomycetaceae bacterium]MDU0969720.1 glycosyltransferase [Actinomycetaceae bacterium]